MRVVVVVVVVVAVLLLLWLLLLLRVCVVVLNWNLLRFIENVCVRVDGVALGSNTRTRNAAKCCLQGIAYTMNEGVRGSDEDDKLETRGGDAMAEEICGSDGAAGSEGAIAAGTRGSRGAAIEECPSQASGERQGSDSAASGDKQGEDAAVSAASDEFPIHMEARCLIL